MFENNYLEETAGQKKKIKLVIWPEIEEKLISEEFESIGSTIVQIAIEDKYITVTLDLDIQYDQLDAQKIGEEEYDGRIEYSLTVMPNRYSDADDFNKRMLCLVDFFIDHLRRQADICEANGFKSTWSVFLSTRQFFDASFCALHEMVPVKCVSFMNLMDRDRSIIHRVVKKEDPHKILPRVYGRTSVPAAMLADFEHDRRLLTIRFPYSEEQTKRSQNAANEKDPRRTQQARVEIADYCVSLQVRYRSIRRVLVKLISSKGIEGHKTLYACELFLHLSAPAAIRRIRIDWNKKENNEGGDKYISRNLLGKAGERYACWNVKFEAREQMMAEEINESPYLRIYIYNLELKQLYELLNRLAMTTERPIEFRTFKDDVHVPFTKYVQSPLDETKCRLRCQENYRLLYMIAALLSRGAVTKDYLLQDTNERDRFIGRCASDFYRMDETDQMLTLEVLERVLAEIDERLDSQPPLRIYARNIERMRSNAEVMKELQEEQTKDGYLRVRKLVITPTRVLFVAPELLMGNRVLRMDPETYPLEKFLRVVFRDDDGQSVHSNNVGALLIDRFILNRLINGFSIAGRQFNYFGSSNSQLRDQGCYFLSATPDEISAFRRNLGSFKMQSAPKMMSRIGQCFTQARETSLELDRRSYAIQHDFEGGKNSKDNPYCFSDGAGRISLQTAVEISRDMKLDGCVPSCYQIRYRGFKGVLSVDTELDAKREWGKKAGIVDTTNLEKRDCWLDLKMAFRPSQKKFNTARENQKFEIVKYSSPVRIALNRPVINVLDQVSLMQSVDLHKRICSRIHLLFDICIRSLTRSLMDESRARGKLSEFCKVIIYEKIDEINFTREPFFRSLIRSSVQASLSLFVHDDHVLSWMILEKLRSKLQIPIPTSLGRGMFGVVDESGLLQYGQVFVRYTRNCALKLPRSSADRIVLIGPVLITKNPTVVSGDIRMFDAVDIPALHHLCDVVVFPRYGPRPHSDEMAGSDLDGDEYTLIWDEQLFLHRNQPAFDYTCLHQEKETTTEEELVLFTSI